MIFDIQFYIGYLIWGDKLIIDAIGDLPDEKYYHKYDELTGSIASKLGHLVGIYEFFIQAIKGNPLNRFPNFEQLTKEQLISKWIISLEKLEDLVMTERNRFIELPLAKGNYVNIEIIFADAIFHTIHHRGQVITLLRLLGKSREDLHPRDINVDYLNYIFKQAKSVVFTK